MPGRSRKDGGRIKTGEGSSGFGLLLPVAQVRRLARRRCESCIQNCGDGERHEHAGCLRATDIRICRWATKANEAKGNTTSVRQTLCARKRLLGSHRDRTTASFLDSDDRAKKLISLAIPAGLEPATLCLEGRCSIQLSYGILRASLYPQTPRS